MNNLYLYLNGVRRGPIEERRVRALLEEQLLRPEDLASAEVQGELKPLAHFLAPAPAVPPLVRPTAVPLPATALGSYSRATLGADEVPFFQTNLHWIVFLRFGLAGLVLFLFAALPLAVGVQALLGSQLGWFLLPLPAFVMVPPALAYASSELVITNMRVLIKTGVIRRQSLEMFVPRIESIAVEQGFLGRLFDYGTVLIRGTGGFQEPFESIARPLEFRNCVQRLQNGSPEGSAGLRQRAG